MNESEEILRILYQDQWLVAVDKPAGMLVHRSFLDKHETRFVMQTLRDQLGQHVYPVHRLDRPTSGVLLFALSSDVARMLSEQNMQQHWQKGYLAVVRGWVQQAGTLDYPLTEELDKIADKFSRTDKAPQEAVTRYKPLQHIELPFAVGRYSSSRYTLIALQPLTGRKHQLRRHLAHLRHPIAGDTSHGDGKHNAFFRQQFANQRLLLAAMQLNLQHPVTTAPLSIRAGLNELNLLFREFGWPADDDFYQQQLSDFLQEV